MWRDTGSRHSIASGAGLVLLLIGAAGSVGAADSRQELVRLEQRLTEALVRADVSTLGTLWADDLVWIGLNGKPASKAQRLSSVKASLPNQLSATNTAVDIRLYGNTGVVTVHSAWTGADEQRSSTNYVATHVWHKRGGQWRLVAAHISNLR